MTHKRKICVISGGRADYGLLKPVMVALNASNHLALQIVVTGSHLSEAFGKTEKIFAEDGFEVHAKINILTHSDTAKDTAKSLGKAIQEFAGILSSLNPDLILVLGDRYEILAAVNTALILRIPVAHICGGDITEGAFDESIRHSITKCSHIHFATNEQSAHRIRQMGENPDYVFTVGSPGLDNIVNQTSCPTAEQWRESVGIDAYEKNILVTSHPATLDHQPSLEQMHIVLNALKKFPDTGIILTGSNADTEGKTLTEAAKTFADSHPNAVFHTSLGMDRYLNTMHYVDAVVGNSSSGLYEAPSFGIPTVSIGTRQKGRLRAESIIDCEVDEQHIPDAIRKAFKMNCRHVVNPYGDGKTAPRIVAILEEIPDYRALLSKPFFEYKHAI